MAFVSCISASTRHKAALKNTDSSRDSWQVCWSVWRLHARTFDHASIAKKDSQEVQSKLYANSLIIEMVDIFW